MVIFDKKVAGLSQGALIQFLLRVKKAVRLRGKVNVLITKSATIRSLNSRFRGKNKPTDVLSFPSIPPYGRNKPDVVGEIVISADIAVQNAVRLGHSLAQEIKILTLHGILHLAGYDHERDNGLMARKESQLRRAFRLPDGLIERAAEGRRRGSGAEKARRTK